MNLVELKAIKIHLQKQLNELDSIQITCLRCEHLQSANTCKKFDAKPPEKWLHGIVDCPEWLYDCVPF